MTDEKKIIETLQRLDNGFESLECEVNAISGRLDNFEHEDNFERAAFRLFCALVSSGRFEDYPSVAKMAVSLTEQFYDRLANPELAPSIASKVKRRSADELTKFADKLKQRADELLSEYVASPNEGRMNIAVQELQKFEREIRDCVTSLRLQAEFQG